MSKMFYGLTAPIPGEPHHLFYIRPDGNRVILDCDTTRGGSRIYLELPRPFRSPAAAKGYVTRTLVDEPVVWSPMDATEADNAGPKES